MLAERMRVLQLPRNSQVPSSLGRYFKFINTENLTVKFTINLTVNSIIHMLIVNIFY